MQCFRVPVFQDPGFSGSRFFRVQVFQGPDPGFRSSRFPVKLSRFLILVGGGGSAFRSFSYNS